MKKNVINRFKNACIGTSFAVLAAAVPPATLSCAADDNKSDDIVILYTNDVHCAIDNNIGYAGLALYKREIEAQYNNVILVDAGDVLQGAPAGTVTKGKAVTELMNAVGYDVCTPGNHDFDYGVDTPLERNSELACGYISCNVFNTQNNKQLFDSYGEGRITIAATPSDTEETAASDSDSMSEAPLPESEDNASSPNTGDHSPVSLAVFMAALGAFTAIMTRKKK